MAPSSKCVPWWDRDCDQFGNQIRSDVREAAHRVWKRVQYEVGVILGDTSEAAELLESAVAMVSVYLNRRNAPAHDPSGLLVVAFHRLVRRLARRRGRIETKGGIGELAKMVQAPSWSDEVERRILLEEIICQLSRANQGIVRLRLRGHSWEQIARMLSTTAAAARRNLYRDLRRAAAQFRTGSRPKPISS